MTCRHSAARLHLEPLDDRCLPSPIVGGSGLRPPGTIVLPEEPTLAPGATVAQPPAPADATVAGRAVGYRDSTGHHVRLYQSRTTYRAFTAYTGQPAVSDHVNVAVADVTGDGVADVVTSVSDQFDGAAAAVPVRVFDGASVLALAANPAAPSALTAVREWNPFGASFSGGCFVAGGDFDGDGKADVVTARGGGGTAQVKIFAGADLADPAVLKLTAAADFAGIDDPNFMGGCHVAVGHLNPDGVPDLMAGAGRTGAPRVAGFDGASIRANWRTATAPARVFNDFYAFPVPANPLFWDGVHVGVADFDGDGYGEVLAGERAFGGRKWVVYDGEDAATTFGGTLTVWWEREFNVPRANPDGVVLNSGTPMLLAANLDGDAKTDLVVSYTARGAVDFYLGRNVCRNGWMLFPTRLLPAGIDPFQGTWVG